MSLLPSQCQKVGAAQDAAQRELVEPLARDVVREDGRTYTQCYRSHARAGRAVYLRNSLPGRADGHTFHVFQIEVIDGREQLGSELSKHFSLGMAMDVAAKE